MKSGTVAVIGRANAGKSTLVNVLVGEKVAIVSPKPQTTRDRILGILNREGRQIVFVDTPGIYRQRNALTGIMMRTTENTSRDVDVILYVHDGHAGVEESDIALMKKYASLGIPMLVAYTKTDIMQKDRIPEDVKKIVEGGVEKDIFPVSAREEKAARRAADGVFVFFQKRLRCGAVAALRGGGELFVRHRRCLTASYAAIPNATDALSELTFPKSGRDKILSHFFFVRAPTPLFSPPTTRAMSPVRSAE